jgi:small subunit ribosomal protein S2
MNTIEENLIAADTGVLEEMTKAGILYGRKKTKTHPRMKPYIYATRNTIEIFDLSHTLSELDKAIEFLKEVVKKSGLILIIGTQPAAKSLIKEFALKFSFPYVVDRWLGGTLTNFKTLSQRTAYYLKLKADQESGALEKYTKKERTMLDKEIKKLGVNFGGLEKLTRRPDAIILIDSNIHETAVREARRLNIPIIALINSDSDPEKITYPIPGNSNAKSSIEWMLKRMEESLLKTEKLKNSKTESF